MNAEMDRFGNTKHVLTILLEHEAREITLHFTAETATPAPLPDFLGAMAGKRSVRGQRL